MKTWNMLTLQQKIVRWENVLRVLRGLSRHERKKHFDMGTWGEKTECGTVACAAGHCGLDPWFRKNGLKLNFTKLDKIWEDGAVEWDADFEVPLNVIGDRDIDVVEAFFGMRGTQDIFYDTTPRHVGAVINQVRRHLTRLRKGEDVE